MHNALTTIKRHKIIILIICFGLTSIFVYLQPNSRAVTKHVPLSQALSNINGWSVTEYDQLDPKIVKALELDDYASQHYSNGNKTVSLYIGYYLTSDKIGAAHSPLVCFPGQGWVPSKAEKKSLMVQGNTIRLMSMMVTRGEIQELVLYWFQAFDKSSPGTLLQKAYGLLAKSIHNKEDNAFVRVTVPVADGDIEGAFTSGTQFIKAFYPVFLEYVKTG